ncbi:MAG: metallophosphoesterase family protein [Tannerella sp.]|jgi:3',5'-cyclic AMP phosphodiesterase CpdA|nr:metallophosphoesterase family protein [Tannerella sp.]
MTTNKILTAGIMACLTVFSLPAKVPATGDFHFNADGKFKIMQITDTHIIWDSPHSQETVIMLQQVLDAENPDLVIFTGDVVTGKPYRKGLDMVVEPLLSRQIPWALVPGNHDDEQDLSREELAEMLHGYPFFAGKMRKIKNVTGYGNYVLEVRGHGSKSVKALLYCMDSGAYSGMKPLVDGYAWFAFDQVDWYRRTSQKYTSANGGQPLPALAFFHIPLPEYRMAVHGGTVGTGSRLEDECSPDVNSGMFLSMLEKGDVMGTFVGHDHVNDYVVNYYGIALVYGRFSGSKTTYTQMKNGVRLIELTENRRGFRTWVRLNEDIVIEDIRVPDDF